MHKTCTRFILKFLSLFQFFPFLLFLLVTSVSPVLLVSAFLEAFLLAAIIGMEIIETNTSFLESFS